MTKQAERFLPLTHSTYLILIALIKPAHGYGIMQKIEEMSDGRERMGPGTLYGALGKLTKQGLIRMVDEIERRKVYELTDLGKEVTLLEFQRLKFLVERTGEFVTALEGLS
ncbi:MAG: PadR family transcriptional regulator [Tuberibacillus sp.]